MKVTTWYNQIGFSSNPFSVKPAAFSDELFGFEDKFDKLAKDVQEGDFYIVTGAYGNGKTTMLKKILNSLKGKRVIYHNYLKSDKEVDFQELLTGMSMFRKILGMKRAGNILLLDEAKEINKDDLKNIEELSEQGYLKSVIFVSPEDIEVTEKIGKKLNGNKIDLGKISDKSAIELVRIRIGKLKLLPDKMIVEIFKIDRNPRNFLRNCEDICKYAVDTKTEKVTADLIKEALK
ncbi:MAG: AAA family ATPase [archaeon]